MNGIRVAQKFVDEAVMDKLSVALSHLDAKVGEVDHDGGNGWSRVFEKKVRAPKDERAGKVSTGGEDDRK